MRVIGRLARGRIVGAGRHRHHEQRWHVVGHCPLHDYARQDRRLAGSVAQHAASQTLSVPATAPGALGGCSGFGIAGSTTGALTFSVQTPSHVTCQSIIGKQDNGNGKIVWTTSSHNGSTTLKAGIKITGPTTATLTGTVTTSAGNYLKGEHVLAHLTFSPNIAPQGVGAGTCSNVHKIKSLTANATDFTIAP